MSEECQSCKIERAAKKPPLPPMERVKLDAATTAIGFRHPDLPTYVCPYCDSETLIASAKAALAQRQENQ